MEREFDGKIALVTGAGGGIGLAIAQDLADRGAEVFCLDVKPMPGELQGKSIVYHQGDLRDEGQVRQRLESIGARHGRLNYCVNAAGICFFERDGSIEEMNEDVFTVTMDVNLGGAMRVVRASLPLMRKAGGGAFVHIASAVGLRTMENIIAGGPADAYQISKAALVSLSRSLAMQHAKENIRSNTVCPGSIRSPMTADIYAQAHRVAAMEARTPLGFIGEPADVSAATLFLLSDKARFITGIDLPVDGGILARL